jgi:hypothetical protein
MSVFAVIGSTNPNAIKDAIVKQYGANHYQFAENAWFVPDNGTSKTVADKLGITNGGIGALGVILKFDAYSGWASADAWKWLATQSGVLPNG